MKREAVNVATNATNATAPISKIELKSTPSVNELGGIGKSDNITESSKYIDLFIFISKYNG